MELSLTVEYPGYGIQWLQSRCLIWVLKLMALLILMNIQEGGGGDGQDGCTFTDLLNSYVGCQVGAH